MTAPLLEICLVWVRAAREIRSGSYVSNIHHSPFLMCYFVCTYMHNSKPTDSIKMFYPSNDRFTTGDVYFSVIAVCEIRSASYAPNAHCILFPIQHFVCTYTYNSKTTECTRKFYISNDCSTIEDVYFLG